MITVSELYIHPIKSCRGRSLDCAELDEFGLAGDRRWMIVDDNDSFLTQRDCAAMATIAVDTEPSGLRLLIAGEAVSIACPAPNSPVRLVQVWGDRVQARDAGDVAAQFISQHLQRAARLVYMGEEGVRKVDTDYALAAERVSFADGFPLLLISQASLDDLNARMDAPVPMNRFRPNIVVTGAEPFAEDGWRRLRIGAVELELVKPCQRCVMPSIDQLSGERDRQINRVLASFRRRDRAIYFGMNAIHRGRGSLRVGDEVELL